MSMKHGKYQRYEGAIERKLDRLIELLERQDKLLHWLHEDDEE